jgi:hypothetical protein
MYHYPLARIAAALCDAQMLSVRLHEHVFLVILCRSRIYLPSEVPELKTKDQSCIFRKASCYMLSASGEPPEISYRKIRMVRET